MKGVISCSSQVNKGSTFSGFALFDRIKKPKIVERTMQRDLNQLRVLVVEDNRINRKVVQKFLGDFGVQFHIAENGQEGVTLYTQMQDDIDLILMDIQMPGMSSSSFSLISSVMDGIQATEQIRKMKKGEDIPIIALTAGVTKPEIEKLQQVGFDSYLAKPIDKNRLKEELSHFCKD